MFKNADWLKTVLAAVLLGGCSSHQTPVASGDLPLAETIFQVNDAGTDLLPLSRSALLGAMANAQVIYLGERHDNPYHHQAQRLLLRELIQMGKKPALGFEFFSQEQTGWLMHATQGKPSALHKPTTPATPREALSALRKQLGWEDNPDWEHYVGLLELAREHRLPVFGADLPRATRLRLTRPGRHDLYAVERIGLVNTGLDHPDYRLLMEDKLSRSHCGAASKELLARLYDTWLARNDAMANAIVTMRRDLPSDQPVVVILGAGHVEHGMGVFERVAHLAPTLRQFNLGLVEEEDPPPFRLPKPELAGQTLFPPLHPYIWLTPKASPEGAIDHCAAFKTAAPPAQQ